MNVKKIDDLIDLLQQTKDIETSKTILREYIQSNKVSDWRLSRLFKSVNYPEFEIECFKDYKSFNLKNEWIHLTIKKLCSNHHLIEMNK